MNWGLHVVELVQKSSGGGKGKMLQKDSVILLGPSCFTTHTCQHPKKMLPKLERFAVSIQRNEHALYTPSPQKGSRNSFENHFAGAFGLLSSNGWLARVLI